MTDQIKVMGLVISGKLKLSVPSGRSESLVRLTRLQPHEGASPENEEIDLSEYEGTAIMVTGYDRGGWIYSAEIIDKAGPILTAVVERLSGWKPQA
jgi:hypothetical protein